MRKSMALGLVVALALTISCHRLTRYRPTDGRPVTFRELEELVAVCRVDARHGSWWQRGLLGIRSRNVRYAECMKHHGWKPGAPEFVLETNP